MDQWLEWNGNNKSTINSMYDATLSKFLLEKLNEENYTAL